MGVKVQSFESIQGHPSVENLIFDFIDQCKFLFFPDQWNQVFLDLSKNDIFALILTYRKKQVNMTEIADYLNVPLNTVTGVVNRLEKKQLVHRERSKEDKRVVTIGLTPLGQQFLADEIMQIGAYYVRILDALTQEERTLLFEVINKIFRMLQGDADAAGKKDDTVKTVRRILIE